MVRGERRLRSRKREQRRFVLSSSHHTQYQQGELNLLNIRVESTGNLVTLHCQGRLVRGQETKRLCAALQHQHEIIVDLSGLTVMDAAGMGALVSLQVAGIYLKLANPTDRVRESLRRTNLDSVFEIFESESIDETMRRTPTEATI